MARPVKTADMKPFLFERSFDDRGGARADKAAEAAKQEEQEVEEAEPEIVVTHSEEELAAAKQESYMDGHADGFREGHAEAMDTLERQLNDLLERLAPMVSDLGEAQRDANERAQANLARIVQELMTKMMPVYVREHGSEEALAVVSECLGELQDPGRLTIHLSEDTADLLGDRLTKAAERAGFEGQVRLLTDDDLGPSDVRVDWGAGGAERRYDTIKGAIDAAIDRAVERIEAGLTETDGMLADQTAVPPHTPPVTDDGSGETADEEPDVRENLNAPNDAAKE